MTRFTVDLAELQQVADDMDAYVRTLEQQLAHLDQVVTDLHLTWGGEAATAHLQAHREWAEGAHTMHRALTDMHRAATVAHGNYQGAAQANAQMLSQTR